MFLGIWYPMVTPSRPNTNSLQLGFGTRWRFDEVLVTGLASSVKRRNAANAVASVSITNAGTGYTSVPTVAFSGGGGSGAAGTVVLNPVGITSKANIDNTGKVGGVVGGDAKLFETSENSLVFKLPQDTIKTIRDTCSVVDTSYQIKRVFEQITHK